MRNEKDFLGIRTIKADALYGIHSLRAFENFPYHIPFSSDWYKSLGYVKKACYLTYEQFKQAVEEKYHSSSVPIKLIDNEVIKSLLAAADEMINGVNYDQFIVSGISGGAGTSINMNINEILANMALIRLGHKPGNYSVLDPIEHANIFQSTNDVVPTSLKVAVMFLLKTLETELNHLRFECEHLERETNGMLRLGYTQMQEAVPTSFGRLFSTYSEALSRDWWRVSKCFERIKVVNLGGSAIGTGLTVPRFFIMNVVPNLQKITKLPVTRSENLSDTTSNLDALVEVHAILKACAVNLEKIVSDLRLLGADIIGQPMLQLPRLQAGSTIMPGKVNPVIAEYVISASQRIFSNDGMIASLCARGCLELNAYLPAIGHAMLESMNLLISMVVTVNHRLLKGLIVNERVSYKRLINSPAITTALLPYIGYHKATELAVLMKSKDIDIFEANRSMQAMEEVHLSDVLKPDHLLKLGYSLDDLK